MKKYILFDLDGTISDPKLGITKAVQYSLRSFGIEVADIDKLTPFIGPPLRDSYKKFYGFDDSGAEMAVAKYREYFSETGIFENTLYNEIPELLESLTAAGKTLVIATSKPTVYAARILEHFKINNYFSFVSGSELDGRRSKKDEVIAFAMENCGITSADSAIMIGDREHDIVGAKKCAMESIGVLYGYGDYAELSGAGATYIAESVEKLSEVILCPDRT